MKKNEAKRLIKNCLELKFSEKKFRELINNLVKKLDYNKEFKSYASGKYIPVSFEEHIKSYKRLSQFRNHNSVIDVLIIKLRKKESLERARTMQRNFVARYLDGGRGDKKKEGALVAFIHDDLSSWRFSFVKMEYSWVKDEDTNKINTKKILTPAKRYSFLVGKDEPSHTAQEQLLPLIVSEKIPTLSQIETAFGVEKVTDEFFDDYYELFKNLKKDLLRLKKSDKKIKKEFEKKNIKASLLAKKILGQLVFLYFIQKKGWLGVPKDKSWGDGPKNFIELLFNKKYKVNNKDVEYSNFYNDILEPLFYEALSTDRGVKNYYTPLDCRIPFLNGGLFEPLNDYDWVNTELLIKNKILKKIIDVFSTFNFTVREDEPLEKEVAVDPEMLGKVFEKLLLKEKRKSKGAYYTPRDIVHYMCQETLTNYIYDNLVNENINRNEIKNFVEYGEIAKENDKAKREKEIKSYEYKIHQFIRENAEEIDYKISNMKICDPAIGSGAFPVAMMHEIIKIRDILSNYIDSSENRSIYKFKREAIENSIYGVDIDSSAVDIAKLRLWLSLVVDEENLGDLKPLPNLDYKIMQGNSLLEEFGGVKLNSDKALYKGRLGVDTEEESRLENEIHDLDRSIKKYINTPEKTKRKEIKQKLDEKVLTIFSLEVKNIENNYDEKKININVSDLKEKLKNILKNNKEKPFFLWRVYFAEVFMDNNGFDVIIGNPPYVNTKDLDSDKQDKYEDIYGIRDDLYNYFFLKSFELLKENGYLTFITSNTYLTINSKINLRKLFEKNHIYQVIKLENVFDVPKVEPAILLLKKKNTEEYLYNLEFIDAIDDFENPESYNVEIDHYRNAVDNVFFKPDKTNLQFYNKYNSKMKELLSKWWEKIRTSRKIKKYHDELENYRKVLKPGDVTLLGMVTEGGQGLATANNGRFVAVKEGTKYASKIKNKRPKKLLKAIQENNIKELKNINDKSDAENFLNSKSEKEIRKIFDDLKEEYGRDIFGQGVLYKIIKKDEIADIEKLSEKEKSQGISKKKPHFVLYDKGDREGNRWYLETPYYIDWSEECVEILSNSSKARWQGYDYYFKKGFCWTDVHTYNIKSRLKLKSIHDVKSMSLFSMLKSIPDWYFVCLLNSSLISKIVHNFINDTQTFQMNDARKLPIIIPSEEQLSNFKDIFDKAFDIKKKQFNNDIAKIKAEEKLNHLQKRLDEKVYELYGIEKKT